MAFGTGFYRNLNQPCIFFKNPSLRAHKTVRSTESEIVHRGPSPVQTGDQGFWYGNRTFKSNEQINTAIPAHLAQVSKSHISALVANLKQLCQ